MLDRGRLSIPSDDFFRADPVRLLELFALAARERLEIHPGGDARRHPRRGADRPQGARRPARQRPVPGSADLASTRPRLVLRWMNEAGVFGRFVPDFGRVVAQMQFDMYHHYTVDEHSIRAIGLLAAIERGELKTGPSAVDRDRSSRSRRAACSTSRCCCTTSPRAAAATTASSAPRSRSSSARASASTRPRPRPSPGWSATTCCCRRPRSSATSPTPRRSRISSARCKARSGCGCC